MLNFIHLCEVLMIIIMSMAIKCFIYPIDEIYSVDCVFYSSYVFIMTSLIFRFLVGVFQSWDPSLNVQAQNLQFRKFTTTQEVARKFKFIPLCGVKVPSYHTSFKATMNSHMQCCGIWFRLGLTIFKNMSSDSHKKLLAI